ncbi:MAG TPA: HAD family hydrolase, partial [bacterium]|nr:HAD family hydrolase [bacterium]
SSGVPLWSNYNFSLVQILPPSAGKGNTVLTLSRHLGLLPEEVLVIGDSGNDKDMLDGRFGFRVATVSNAEPEIKETVERNGGYVAENPVSRGIIEIVNKLILGEIKYETGI